jgi:hypothetical protein
MAIWNTVTARSRGPELVPISASSVFSADGGYDEATGLVTRRTEIKTWTIDFHHSTTPPPKDH